MQSKRKRNGLNILCSASLLLLLGLSLALNCKSETSQKDDGVPGRKVTSEAANKFKLPDFATPIAYDLSFEPDFTNFTFRGHETIRLQVNKETNELVLNALELKIAAARVKSAEASTKSGARDSSAQDLAVRYDSSTEKVHFAAARKLQPGSYVLDCSFSGTLNSQLRGFYRSSFEDDNHKKHWLAATQMEPTDARRMFPSFDEPAYKAVFNIRAIIKKNFAAISNAPVKSEVPASADKKAVQFEATPKMSTYLLALIVGEFKSAGKTMSGPVPIQVWAVAGKEQLGKYALGHAAEILRFEASYFGVPYFGRKLDLIALPELGMFSAMENAGAITFHDTVLLADERRSSASRRLDILSAMTHEMAHQWFGDLVTMKWWDDLWLNEAFATWMTPKVLAALYPNSQSSTHAIYSRYSSMSTDSLKSTRAIHAAVVNPSQAVEMFDGITYQKGAAVLAMLEAFVGEKAFQSGIHKYLTEHALGNASAEDFWNAIAAKAADAPVPAIMRSFVFQPGYPQLNLTQSQDGKAVSLTQYRQLKTGQDKSDPALWLLPVTMRSLVPAAERDSRAGVSISRLLAKRTQTFETQDASCPVFINAGAKGYYQTCYEKRSLKRLQEYFDRLSTEEKLVLLNDCSTLILSGDVSVEDYYNFVNLVGKEHDQLIQSDLVYLLGGPDRFISEALRKDYEKWVRLKLAPLLSRLSGWNKNEEDPQVTRDLRQAVLEQLGTYGQDKAVIAGAFALFHKYLKNRSAVDQDLVPVVLDVVAYNGGLQEYDLLLNLYRQTSNPTEKELALFHLALFHQPELARRTLELGMSDQVKQKAGINLIYAVTSNRFTSESGWSFIKEHWDEIIKRFPPESLRGLASVCVVFDSPARETEVRSWYAAHEVPYGKARVARMLESLHARVLFRQQYAKRINKWLEAQLANGLGPIISVPAGRSL